MDRAGDQFLPGSGFAGDEDSRHRFRDALHDRENLLHPRAAADDVGEREFLFERGAEVEVFVLELFPLDRFVDDDLQLFDVERLSDVVEGAGLERLDSRFRRGVGRDHDDGDRRILRFGLAQQLEARAVGEHQVAQDEVGLVFLQSRASIGEGGSRRDAATVLFENSAQEVAKRHLVIDDQ